MSAEPPEIRTFSNLFLDQFRWVVTCHDIKHSGLINLQQAHPWHVGVDCDNGFVANLDYDAFCQMPKPEKSHLISAVISAKAVTPAHRQRLEFVKQLKERLGDAFHLFGRGHQQISDKWEALAPYRFHLVLENAAHRNFLTEKITDAFLASTFPLYYGAPNATDYFSANSFEPIDIFRPKEAIERILHVIDADLDHQRSEAIERARRYVLEEMNMFAMLSRVLSERMVDGPKQSLCLYPKSEHVKLAVGRVGRMLRRAG